MFSALARLLAGLTWRRGRRGKADYPLIIRPDSPAPMTGFESRRLHHTTLAQGGFSPWIARPARSPGYQRPGTISTSTREVLAMPDRLNGLRVRLCSIVWVLVDLGYIGPEDADEMTQRIERMTEREMAAWVRKLAPAELKAS